MNNQNNRSRDVCITNRSVLNCKRDRMDVLFLINVFAGIAALVYLFLHRRFQYWKNRKVPYIEPEFFYGNSRGITTKYNSSEFMKRMYLQLKSAGPISGIYIYIRTQAMVTNLDLVKQILVKDFNIFTNRGNYSNEKDDPITAHLVAIEDDAWRNLRHKITPTFTSGKLKFMFGTVTDIADKLIEVIQNETISTGQLEIKDVMSRFTTDVIGSTAFGIDCNSLEDPTTKFYEMGLKSFSSFNFFKRSFLMTYPNLGRKLHIKSSNKEVREFYIDVVRRTLKYREENPDLQRNDFMHLMTKLKGAEALTFNQIAAQSVVFFLAGKYSVNSIKLALVKNQNIFRVRNKFNDLDVLYV